MDKTTEIKIAVIGNVDSGKSSLIGTLISGKNDNGKGSNRELVLNFPHELSSGCTSSISHQILGFRQDGTIIHNENKNKSISWPKVVKESNKLINFIDLAGHEKYLRTTIHGLASNHPDYSFIMIEGRGLRGMTKEHIMLAMAFNIPFAVIVTKTDLYPKSIIDGTVSQICKLFKNTKLQTWRILNKQDLEIPLSQAGKKFVPIFTVSSVTGDSIPLLTNFMHSLSTQDNYQKEIDKPLEMSIIETFSVPGIGTVAHGFVSSGTARVGNKVIIGPDSNGGYHTSKIRSIHFKRLDVDISLAGRHCTVCLPGIERRLLKQGMYILDANAEKIAVREFTAEIKVLSNHAITIKKGYEPILHMNNIRLATRIVDIQTAVDKTAVDKTAVDSDSDKDEFRCIRGGERAIVKFCFMARPVYLKNDTQFIFREGKTRGFGKVTKSENKL